MTAARDRRPVRPDRARGEELRPGRGDHRPEPAVGPETVIVPLLNGMRHIDALDAAFGPASVYGGVCMIAGTLTDEGDVVQLTGLQQARVRPAGRRPGPAPGGGDRGAVRGGVRLRGHDHDHPADVGEMAVPGQPRGGDDADAQPRGRGAGGAGRPGLHRPGDRRSGRHRDSSGPPAARASTDVPARQHHQRPQSPDNLVDVPRHAQAGRPVEADEIVGDLVATRNDWASTRRCTRRRTRICRSTPAAGPADRSRMLRSP